MLSSNPNITWEIVRDNLDKPWDWFVLSINPSITWEIVRDNPDRPWDWQHICLNPNITWEIVQNNPDKPWSMWSLSQNPNITWEIVRNNGEYQWGTLGILRNPGIDMDDVILNKIEYQTEYYDDFWYNISPNKFLYDPYVYRREKSKDIKWRRRKHLNIFEKFSPFSRNVDKLISRRINYI